MHKQGNHAPQIDIEHAAETKTREPRQRAAKKSKRDDIHPSLRALPDYPE